jgi:hypothetical protein
MAKDRADGASLPSSLRIRLIIQIAALAVAWNLLDRNGTLDALSNYAFVLNPYQHACGLSPHLKDFVIVSGNVVSGNSTVPGLGQSFPPSGVCFPSSGSHDFLNTTAVSQPLQCTSGAPVLLPSSSPIPALQLPPPAGT